MGRKEEIKEEIRRLKKRGRNKLFRKSVIIIIIIGVIFCAYFFIISPTFVTKPFLEKPELQAGEDIGTEHVNWIVNELGGYKLHASPSGDEPELELITDDKTFKITFKGNNVSSSLDSAADPDVRLIVDREAFVEIFFADDVKEEIKNLYNEGEFVIELLKDETILALKGYKGSYDELMG